MLEPPFDLIRCSWPRPVAHQDGRWTSEPDWTAPPMPAPPQPTWTTVGDEPCWTIDWCAHFQGGLKHWEARPGGEMRGFHVVFYLRVNVSGTLLFWDDDGSLIRRGGELIHADRSVHPPTQSEIEVKKGEVLEVAQWQCYGGWTWGARIADALDQEVDAGEVLRPYLNAVRRRLTHADGPPLKMYFGGTTPLRTGLALYSMILNGYRPSEVLVFGEYQWSPKSRAVFEALLPFARIVSTEEVLDRTASSGGPRLADLAQRHFLVMKTCAGVLYPPDAYCLMDDDVFILDHVGEGLEAFRHCDLVFAPDDDYSADYAAAWGAEGRDLPWRTGRFNAGLYWLRRVHDPHRLAAAMLRVSPAREPTWQWEQGFLASQYAHTRPCQLSTQRYFYPYFDGLPGGVLGYDYAGNPCGFASIHFGGLAEKPGDAAARLLTPFILERNL